MPNYRFVSFFCMVSMAAACFACLVSATVLPTDHLPITVNERQRLSDEHNREVVFHGANVVAKGFPWAPTRDGFTWDDSFVAHDMQVMKDLGLNAIRLGAMWPGVEPVRGQYNATYLQVLADIVNESASYGIYTLLDMHQDVLADRFCGEGVPEWAAVANTTNFPWPLSGTPYNTSGPNSMPDPYALQCAEHNWAEYYPTEAVGEAFQNLYSNAYGLADSWAQFWVVVAEAVGSKLGGAVLGYELINEPWAGNVWKNPLLMAPTVADRVNLQPMYDMVSPLIRAVDPLHALFFEGVTWDWFGVGFSHPPGGAEHANRSVLSYHFYMPPDFSLDVQMDARKKDMERLNVGGFLTEFGVHVCKGCGTIIAEQIMAKCDEMFQSWAFWQLKPFPGNKTGSGGFSPLYFNNGSVIPAMAYNLSRTYAQAIAGTGNTMAFDLASGVFRLSYTTSNTRVRKPETVIYASQMYHYPSGMNVTILPAGLVASAAIVFNTTRDDPNLFTVTHDPARVPSGTTIEITIAPR